MTLTSRDIETWRGMIRGRLWLSKDFPAAFAERRSPQQFGTAQRGRKELIMALEIAMCSCVSITLPASS